jgi:hypothetical protein
MVTVSINGSTATFEVQGLHRLWAFKNRLEIPLAHVTDVRVADSKVVRGWWKGFRLPGTHLPGFITAGTFHKEGKRTFWDVRNPDRAIVVDLNGEPYHQLIVEVEDPMVEVARFQAAPLT